MKLLAEHPYVKVERKVANFKQENIEHERIISLYEEKVVTQHRVFPMSIVTDFSFRTIANEGGFLYLHTLRGVYTYQVKTSPEAFIDTYRTYFKEANM